MTDREDADEYRVVQAENLFNLFQEAKGRPAKTFEELEEWLGSPEGEAALAYDRTPPMAG